MLARRSPIPHSPTPPPLCVSPRTPQMVGVPFRFVTPYSTPSQPRYIGSSCVSQLLNTTVPKITSLKCSLIHTLLATYLLLLIDAVKTVLSF